MTAAGGVHHVAILVRDLPAAEAFYRRVLGLAVHRRQGERSVWLDLGQGAFLALEKIASPVRDGGPDAERPGWHLVALGIGPEDRTSWERRLADAGVAVTHRTDFTLYIQDPEGNRIGLSHWPEAAPASGEAQG